MNRYILTKQATSDLDEVSLHPVQVAEAEIVERVENDLFAKFELLGSYPGLGHLRRDLTALPLFFLSSDQYLIAYERDERGIIIHAVLHGARDVKGILRGRIF